MNETDIQMLDHVQHLVYRHTDMLNYQEYNTVEFMNIQFELESVRGMKPDEFGFFSFRHLPLDWVCYPMECEDGKIVWIAMNKKTNHPRGSYLTYFEAVQAVIDHVQQQEKTTEKIQEKVKDFEEKMKKNSLDEKYKDVNPQAKPKEKKETYVSKYLERLAGRTKSMYQDTKEKIMERNQKLRDQDYLTALIEH